MNIKALCSFETSWVSIRHRDIQSYKYGPESAEQMSLE